MSINEKTHWREKELSYDQVIDKYPDIPPILALKIDVSRRGIAYTDAAFAKVDSNKHHVEPFNYMIGHGKQISPIGLFLRDGSVICQGHQEVYDWTYRDPYILDVVDDKLVIVDNDRIFEEAKFWEKPDFYDKYTSNGTPMREIASARPQRLTIAPATKCHFWDVPKEGCKYCALFSAHRSANDEGDIRDDKWFSDVTETVEEALKQKGRYASFHMTAGSTLSGKEIFDDEVDLYIKTLKAAERVIDAKKFPVKLVASAFSKKQLQRMYEETAITTYTTDLEVLNKNLFGWVCPGKNRLVGYDEWKHRLYDAVEIFGRGNVDCGIVGGVETAQPNGFDDEQEALNNVLTEAEEIASHGVSFADCVWNTLPGAIFMKQKTPSLEYYVQLALGLAEVRRKNGLNIYTDDYRRCGNHPNTDLARID